MYKDFTDINVGRLTRDQAANVAREIRDLWRYLGDVRPQGDPKRRAQLKVTIDKFDQYHFYLNAQALKLMLLYCKDLPDPHPPASKQATLQDCPDEVPEFLRWDEPAR